VHVIVAMGRAARMTPTVEFSDDGSFHGGDFHRDFTLSITKALGDQLADALKKLDQVPLSATNIHRLKEKAGVYQLYLNGEFVYVGKADKSVPDRLKNHLRKLSGRRGISLSDVTFSCLYVAEDFSALAPEQLLINHHKGLGKIPWNNNGFGNKDPGRNRDSTILKANHFDMIYPIDLEYVIEGLTPGPNTLHRLLDQLKSALPFNFRYKSSLDFKTCFVEVPRSRMKADEVFRLISAELPAQWQIVALMGYVIMYDDAQTYPSAWRYYHRGEALEASPDTEPAGEIPEVNGANAAE
jgi:hypothetical protein